MRGIDGNLAWDNLSGEGVEWRRRAEEGERAKDICAKKRN